MKNYENCEKEGPRATLFQGRNFTLSIKQPKNEAAAQPQNSQQVQGEGVPHSTKKQTCPLW